MRIAHFTNTYLPTISGVVRNVTSLERALREQGNQVFIFTENTGGDPNGAPHVFRYPTLGRRLPMDFPAILPYSRAIDALLPQLRLDIIHTHHPFSLGHAALAKARGLGIPVVFTFHTLYWEHAHYVPPRSKITETLVRMVICRRIKKFLPRCDHIVVYTEDLRSLLRSRFDVENQVSVVPTGIDPAPYRRLDRSVLRSKLGWERSRILISAGRLGAEKNWITFLDAGMRAMEQHPELNIVILGDGPEKARLEQFVRRRQRGSQVSFLGKVPFAAVPGYLKAADLFGFASVTETIGRVTMEAMAAGLPIVAVNAMGTRDIVEHHGEGLLTENDPVALARAIGRLLADPHLRARYGHRSARKGRTFNLCKEAQMLLKVYEQTICATG